MTTHIFGAPRTQNSRATNSLRRPAYNCHAHLQYHYTFPVKIITSCYVQRSAMSVFMIHKKNNEKDKKRRRRDYVVVMVVVVFVVVITG